LIDSYEDISASVARACRIVAGVDIEPAQVRPFVGKSLSHTFGKLLPDADESTRKRCAEEYKAYFFDHCADRSRLFPGVEETMRALKASGFHLAVATTKMTFMAVRVCEAFNLIFLLDHIQGTDDFPAKPAPDVILRACEAIGVSPSQAVMVGDTIGDISAAAAAGCLPLGVSYGIGAADDLRNAGAKTVFDGMMELAPYLRSLGAAIADKRAEGTE